MAQLQFWSAENNRALPREEMQGRFDKISSEINQLTNDGTLEGDLAAMNKLNSLGSKIDELLAKMPTSGFLGLAPEINALKAALAEKTDELFHDYSSARLIPSMSS